MPRRTRTAQPTQDDIEVDEQEQIHSQHDSVQDADQPMNSEDEEPQQEQKPFARSKKSSSRKSKSATTKTKSEKGRKSRARRDASDDEGGSDDSDAAPPFDRLEFLATARPIPKEVASKIKGLVDDWGQVLHQVKHVGFGLVTETAVAVAEVSGNTEDGKDAIEDLDAVMRQLIDAQREFQVHQACLESLNQRIATGEVIDKLEDEYTSETKDGMEMYKSRTTRQKYAKNDDYFKFRDQVWEVNHEDAMPPLGDLIPREDADSDAESDIEVGGITQDYKCPLTLTHLTEPLTSKLCKHSFSADAIREYLSRGKKTCPASGCNQTIGISDLEPNDELAKRAADFARRARRREEDSDESDGEVVD